MSSKLYIKSALNTSGQSGVFTSVELIKGQMVLRLTGEVLNFPTRTSIQIRRGLHIEDEIGAFINHSPHPSCKIEGRKVVSLRPIEIDEEITFDYSKNEDKLANPFVCSTTGDYISGKSGEE